MELQPEFPLNGSSSSSSSSNDTTAADGASPPSVSLVATGVGLYSLSFLTFVGNAMVLHAIRTEKRLQTVSNMFIMSLALADLTVGCIVMPISSAYALTGDWPFGLAVCQFWLSVDYTASTASIFNLFILSLDRYWSITSPLRYLRRRTKKRALVMIALAWTGASMWMVPVLGWHTIVAGGERHVPETVCETEFATNMTFKVVTSILNFYIPTSCMVVLYVRIFLAIRRRSRDIHRLGAYTSNPNGNGNCSASPAAAAAGANAANHISHTNQVTIASSTLAEPTFEPEISSRSPSSSSSSPSTPTKGTATNLRLTPHVRRQQLVSSSTGNNSKRRTRRGEDAEEGGGQREEGFCRMSNGCLVTAASTGAGGGGRRSGAATATLRTSFPASPSAAVSFKTKKNKEEDEEGESCEFHHRLAVLGFHHHRHHHRQQQWQEQRESGAIAAKKKEEEEGCHGLNSNVGGGGGCGGGGKRGDFRGGIPVSEEAKECSKARATRKPVETLALFEDVKVRVEYVTSPMAIKRNRAEGPRQRLDQSADEEGDNVSLNSLGETQIETERREWEGEGRNRRKGASSVAADCEESTAPRSATCRCREGGGRGPSTVLQRMRQQDGGGGSRGRSGTGMRMEISPPPPPLAPRQLLALGHREAEVAVVARGVGGKRKGMPMMLKKKNVPSSLSPPKNGGHPHHHHHGDCGDHDHSRHLHCYRSSRRAPPANNSHSKQADKKSPSSSSLLLVSGGGGEGPDCFRGGGRRLLSPSSEKEAFAAPLQNRASAALSSAPSASVSTVTIGTMTSSSSAHRKRRRRRKLRKGEEEGEEEEGEFQNRAGGEAGEDEGEKSSKWLEGFLSRTLSRRLTKEGAKGKGARAHRASANLILAQEKKAATQLGVIVGAFILCWLPYFTLFMVVAYCGVRGVREGEGENGGGECGVNPTLFTATIWFGYFNSALNPILYPLCNANFKRAFKQMLGLSPPPPPPSSAASDLKKKQILHEQQQPQQPLQQQQQQTKKKDRERRRQKKGAE